jgi:hypothetical protein
MAFNLFGPPTKDDIRVGYIDPNLGYVEGFTICQANEYAIKNPGTTFIFRNGNNVIQYLNVNEVNQLDPNILTSTDECGGINQKKECGPPTIQLFGGGGIGAAGNPIIGRDGALLAVDVVRGGNGYQYPPLVAAKDNCNYGSGATLTAVLGEVAETIETYENEADFEDYELCEPTDVGYGRRYGPNGEDLGPWEPRSYTEPGEDPIRKEVEEFEKIVRRLARTPFWTTRSAKPTKITCSDARVIPSKYDVTFPAWNEFMNSYAISPVAASNVRGSDFAGRLFTFEWTEDFPLDGEYIFRGLCDNTAQLYVDNLKVTDLDGFSAPVIPIKKTITKGIHNIRVDLLNIPIGESGGILTRTIFNTVDFISKANRTLWRGKPFRWNGTDTFNSLMNKSAVLPFDPESNESQRQSFSGEHEIIWSNVNFPTDGLYTIQFAVDDAVDLNIGDFQINSNGNDGIKWREITKTHFFKKGNYKIQVRLKQGYIGALSRSNPMGIAMNITVGEVLSDIISPKSWNENPMGISLTIDAPEPTVPKEPAPIQEGRCPPNPIWTTRFPGAKETWYPVKFNGSKSPQGKKEPWAKFFNRYAISPVPPLDTPGSDAGGVLFTNSWEIDIPYDGFYKFAVQRDETAKIYLDGNIAFDIKTAGDDIWRDFRDKPKFQKVFITKGRHTISVELENSTTEVFGQVYQKIFRTKDWQSGGISVNGVTYEGPKLFNFKTGSWGEFMNSDSVSPLLPPLDIENQEINGTKTYVWKGVNFPESGQYDIRFLADNFATLKIGNIQALTSQGFAENPQVFKVNVTQGRYDVVVESTNIPERTSIFRENPTGFALDIRKNVTVRQDYGKSWDENPIGIGAILIPPPCPRRIRGRGVVTDVIVNDPGNGYLPPAPQLPGYPVALRLKEVIVENPGINYNCGVDELRITPSNGAELDYICDPFGKIREVKVLNPGLGFTEYPEIRLISETGVNASFRPVFEVVRDPIVLPERLIQVTDLVGLKQTGYVNGRPYYGAVYYDQGVRYAGFYETVGDLVQVYDTLQESITAQVTTVPNAIQRQGTDITSNDPRLNIPGTPQNLI